MFCDNELDINVDGYMSNQPAQVTYITNWLCTMYHHGDLVIYII